MAITAVLKGLMHTESQEKEPPEITKIEMSSPIEVEAEAGIEAARNPEPDGTVQPETDASPEQEARGVDDDGGRIETVETPPAFIEAKKVLHKKKFRE